MNTILFNYFEVYDSDDVKTWIPLGGESTVEDSLSKCKCLKDLAGKVLDQARTRVAVAKHQVQGESVEFMPGLGYVRGTVLFATPSNPKRFALRAMSFCDVNMPVE